MTCQRLFLLLMTAGLWLGSIGEVSAQFQQKHARELQKIRTDLTKSNGLIKRGDIEEAAEIVTSAESRLMTVMKEARVNTNYRPVAILARSILLQKAQIQRAGGAGKPAGNGDGPMGADGVSFVKDVAPILQRRCTGCHGNNGRGGLSLTSFNAMRKGGSSGLLLTAGNSAGSLLHQRITSNGADMMPKNGTRLPVNEINTIATWINEGAKFDGDDPDLALNRLKVPGANGGGTPTGPVKIEILKPTGDETVSFKKDVAPFMVNICMRCHSGNDPESGFSMETFEKLMIGGSSGRVVIPGNLDASRLWDLAGKQKPIKMPPGDALITRSNWNALRTWIEEGARFDGEDPKAPLRALVPTEAELRAKELAAMSPAQFAEFRTKRSGEIWEQVMRDIEPRTIETKSFILHGNVSQTRLQEVANWAEGQAETLKKTFGEKGEPLWKGKLALFVVNDRFAYEEFGFTLLNRRVPNGQFGHAIVTPTFEEAYAVLEDIGDVATAEKPGMKLNVLNTVTKAYFARGGGDLPSWVRVGTGLALAADGEKDNPYLEYLESQVRTHLRGVSKPEDVFKEGTFSPEGTRSVGFTLSRFLIKRGGAARYGQFVSALQKGTEMSKALQGVYRLSPKNLAGSYAASAVR